jgi:hypothetical protein
MDPEGDRGLNRPTFDGILMGKTAFWVDISARNYRPYGI